MKRQSKTTLKDIMAYAQLKGLDIDPILDAYNENPDKAIHMFDKMMHGNKIPTVSLTDKGNIDEGVVHALQLAINNDIACTKRLIKGIHSHVKTKDEGGNHWVMIMITSDFSDHVEEEHMIFPTEAKKDDGTDNAIRAAIDEMSFRYLLAL